MENNIEKLQEFIKSLAKAVKEAWGKIKDLWKNKLAIIKKVVVKWYQLEEEKPVKILSQYRRDFSRRKITHQVINRKPKHMVRKIIH